MESVAMSEHRADTPEQVLKFLPKEWPNSYGAQVEEVGQAIVTKIQRAADLSNENCDRALALAHKLSMQLRTAEDRISQLESEGRTLSRSRGPRRTLASNNSERDRGKAYRSEISQRRRTNPASQRCRAMTSVETSRNRLTNLPTRCQLESPTTTTSAPSRSVGRAASRFGKSLKSAAQNLPK